MNTMSLTHELEKSACRTELKTDTSEAIRAAREVLLQELELLFQLRDQTYSEVSFITGMSIGQHYGQVIQRFRSLIQGCRAEEIHYDACEPDVRRLTRCTTPKSGKRSDSKFFTDSPDTSACPLPIE